MTFFRHNCQACQQFGLPKLSEKCEYCGYSRIDIEKLRFYNFIQHKAMQRYFSYFKEKREARHKR